MCMAWLNECLSKSGVVPSEHFVKVSRWRCSIFSSTVGPTRYDAFDGFGRLPINSSEKNMQKWNEHFTETMIWRVHCSFWLKQISLPSLSPSRALIASMHIKTVSGENEAWRCFVTCNVSAATEISFNVSRYFTSHLEQFPSFLPLRIRFVVPFLFSLFFISRSQHISCSMFFTTTSRPETYVLCSRRCSGFHLSSPLVTIAVEYA